MAPIQKRGGGFKQNAGNWQNPRNGGVKKNFSKPGGRSGGFSKPDDSNNSNYQALGQNRRETPAEAPKPKKRVKKMEIRGGQLLPTEDASDDEEYEQTREAPESDDSSDDEPAPKRPTQSKPSQKPQGKTDEPFNPNKQPLGAKSTRKPKDGLTDFQRAKQTYNRIQEERKEAAERRRLNEERRQEEREVAQLARNRRGKALKLRTKKGQPNLNAVMECIVEKLERKRDRENRNQGR
uniref:PP28 domain-containing protein n=1 Tax=Panagrellus redivivus TaxID=6233 RepID=A0A7E4VUV9_PANRE